MAGKRNSFNFDVPLWGIIGAWIVMPPVGAIMTVLRIVSEIYKNSEQSEEFSAAKAREELEKKINKAKESAEKVTQSKKKKKSGKKSDSSISAKVLGIIFLILAAAFLILAASSPETVFTSVGTIIRSALMVVVPTGLGILFLALSGKGKSKREVRLSRIRVLIGKNDSYNLVKLASASGTSVKRIRKDVQRMINNGEFGKEAYIDLGTNNFMRSPSAVPDTATYEYKNSRGSTFGSKKADAVIDDLGSAGTNENFKKIIKEIRRLNDEIADEPVSERIYRIEEHTKNIFDYVSDHPESMPQIRSFMNYYLPTTLKLLESYSRIERVGVAGENMKKSKKDIEATLDLLVKAFEMQLDCLFSSESMDISSDISVLEAMISKDGLNGKKDFDLGGMQAEEK